MIASFSRPLCGCAGVLVVCLVLGFPAPVAAGWLDNLAVAETHRLEKGDF